MKSYCSTIKTPQEIASEIFKGTKVESAYDKQGRFSHLLAKLPKDKFCALYSEETTATVFIYGHWLQLSLENKYKTIINRENNVRLILTQSVNELEQCFLEFSYLGRKIYKVKIKSIFIEDLFNTPEGFYLIARLTIRAFEKINKVSYFKKYFKKELPVVQIIPDEQDEYYFDSTQVNLQ